MAHPVGVDDGNGGRPMSRLLPWLSTISRRLAGSAVNFRNVLYETQCYCTWDHVVNSSCRDGAHVVGALFCVRALVSLAKVVSTLFFAAEYSLSFPLGTLHLSLLRPSIDLVPFPKAA